MKEMEHLLQDLNPEQREAVEYRGGPLLILAGAGSGKTRAITYRIAGLIATGEAKPWQILALTFTNKAAGEMKSRIESLVGPAAKQVWMSTFHSFGARFLRMEGHRIGLNRQFPILDEDDRERIIRDVVKELGLDTKKADPRKIAVEISKAKSEFKSPEEFLAEAESLIKQYGSRQLPKRVSARIYEIYEDRRREMSAMDFDDLLLAPLNILEEHPEVAEIYQKKFVHILVDEYQDTNRPQYLMVKNLSQGHRNLCVVGDDDQSIYRWRGADLRNILEFEKDFADTHIVKLESNYRSTATILEAASSLIQKNRGRRVKNLRATRPEGLPIKIITAADADDEADRIAGEIDTLTAAGQSRENGFPGYGDIAVFFRTAAQSRALEDAMIAHSIPYQVVGGIRFYERKEIKDALAYLRLIANPTDEFSLTRVVNVPPRGLGPKALSTLNQVRIDQSAPEKPVTLFEILTRATEFPSIPTRVGKTVSDFAQMILRRRKAAEEQTFSLTVEEEPIQSEPSETENSLTLDRSLRTGIPALISAILRESTLMDVLYSSKDPKDQSAAENLRELIVAAGRMNSTVREILAGEHPEKTEVSLLEALDVYLETVSLLGTIDNYQEGKGQVVLMTLHSAKGLEFPIVFMSGMEEGLCPHSFSLDDRAELEEERRLCYVGITRAKEQCYISHAGTRYLMGTSQSMRPSRFLREIPAERVEYSAAQFVYGRAQAEEEAAAADEASEVVRTDIDFGVGDTVRHKTFGIGIVKKIEPIESTHRVTVEFGRFGEKSFVQRIARLKRC